MLHAFALSLLPTIWIVDAANGPGTNFTSLPAAVAVAASGDTIIVRPGTYAAFVSIGKALNVRGAGGSATLVLPSASVPALRVEQVPAGAEFVLQGLFVRSPSTGASAATILGCAPGTAVIQSCRFDGGDTEHAHGLHVLNGTTYASRCQFLGGPMSPFFGGDDSHGVAVDSGMFAAVDCSFVGGTSPPIFDGGFTTMGSGLRVASGVATIHDSSLIGGSVITNRLFAGSGLRAEGTSRVRLAGTTAVAVQAGTGGVPTPDIFASATAAVSLHGNVLVATYTANVAFEAPLPRLRLTVFARADGTVLPTLPLTMAVDVALPNAPFFLGIGLDPRFSTALAPLTLGELLVPAADFVLLSTLDGAGHWSVTMPSFVHVLGTPLYGQAAVFDAATGRIRMSNFESRTFVF